MPDGLAAIRQRFVLYRCRGFNAEAQADIERLLAIAEAAHERSEQDGYCVLCRRDISFPAGENHHDRGCPLAALDRDTPTA